MQEVLQDWNRLARERGAQETETALRRYWETLAEVSEKLGHLYAAQAGEGGTATWERASLLADPARLEERLRMVEERVQALEKAAAPKWWQFWRKRRLHPAEQRSDAV